MRMLIVISMVLAAGVVDVPVANPEDPWGLRVTEALAGITTVEQASAVSRTLIGGISVADYQRLRSALEVHGSLVRSASTADDVRAWVGTALAADEDLRARIAAGAYAGAHRAADGALRVPTAEALATWTDERLEVTPAQWMLWWHPGANRRDADEAGRWFASRGPDGWRQSSTGAVRSWGVRRGREFVDTGMDLAQALGLPAAACTPRQVEWTDPEVEGGPARVGVFIAAVTGNPAAAIGAPASLRTLTVSARPDECLDLEEVQAAVERVDRALLEKPGAG